MERRIYEKRIGCYEKIQVLENKNKSKKKKLVKWLYDEVEEIIYKEE